MKAWVRSMVENVKTFFDEYGKIFAVGASLLVGLVSLSLIASLASPHMLRISFLDVGQGDSILIQTPSGHNMLIDGGPTDGVLTKVGSKMSYFDRSLDVVLATHDDSDHVTGLIPILEKYDVSTVVMSPIRSDTDIARNLHTRMDAETNDEHIGRRGDMIDFGDGVAAHVLYPNGGVPTKTDTNDASVCVIITYGEHSFLLTGDLPSKHEPQLFGENLPHNVTVYKAGHHGSKTSSSETLLSYIHPEYAVISAGKDNRYGHPNPEAVERLQKYSKKILSMIDRGTITFASNGKMLSVTTEK